MIDFYRFDTPWVYLWLVLQTAKKKFILHSDCLLWQARWDYLARSGFSRKARSRWLDIGLSTCFHYYWPQLCVRPWKCEKKNLASIQPSWPHAWSIRHICPSAGMLVQGWLKTGRSYSSSCQREMSNQGWVQLEQGFPNLDSFPPENSRKGSFKGVGGLVDGKNCQVLDC